MRDVSYKVVIEDKNPDAVRSFLHNSIRDFNYPFLGHYTLKRFSAYIQDENQAVIAGVAGFIMPEHAVCRLEHVWVHENYRSKGIGTKIIQSVEEYAKSHTCKVMQLSTMDFQGVEFYKKSGFEVIGEIPAWFCGKTEIFCVKVI